MGNEQINQINILKTKTLHKPDFCLWEIIYSHINISSGRLINKFKNALHTQWKPMVIVRILDLILLLSSDSF